MRQHSKGAAFAKPKPTFIFTTTRLLHYYASQWSQDVAPVVSGSSRW